MDASGGFMGIGTRMTWLALVSMLVCAVGIANAMLMSVTERFREIATLKCLGALDAFIMSVFLIEAGLLGIVGGLGGAIAGFLLAGTRMAFAFKSLLWDAFPWQEVFVAGLISILVGMLLAAISAVYPSFRAARLAPMEAMRIE
jgi:ABC-type antimicrobial peptide transport system permease subunit